MKSVVTEIPQEAVALDSPPPPLQTPQQAEQPAQDIVGEASKSGYLGRVP